MVCGTIFGWTSPSLPKLMDPSSPFPITEDEATWIASLSAIGSMLGPFPAGNLFFRKFCSEQIVGSRQKIIVYEA